MKSNVIKIKTYAHFIRNGNSDIIMDVHKGNFCEMLEARMM